MFRRLRLKLALQFTALVFILMLVLGAVFIAIEFTDVNRQLDARLERQAALVRDKMRLPVSVAAGALAAPGGVQRAARVG